MRKVMFALPLLLAACTDYEVSKDVTPDQPPQPGSITGRVCDPTGRTWLSDAMAYTNVFDSSGQIVDVRKAFSDRDGYWTLDNLAADRQYTYYVQYGDQILDTQDVWVADGDNVQLKEPDCFDPLALNIAVVTGDYDDVQLVLDQMGFQSYTLIDGNDETALTGFLTNVENLKQYDIVLFNGGIIEDGVIYDRNPSNEVPDQIMANLQAYVENGGSVYASDWSYDVVERAWPDAIDFLGDDDIADAAQLGEYDDVDAMVTDEALASFLGKNTIQIQYDLPVWPPISSVEPYVSIHLTGTVHYREGESTYTLASVPMLVSFSGGKGRVGFSTFRVAANQSNDMVLTLQYMMHNL